MARIQHKRTDALSGGQALKPDQSNMAFGELAINYSVDPAIFIKARGSIPDSEQLVQITGKNAYGNGNADITINVNEGLSVSNPKFNLADTDNHSVTLTLNAATATKIGGIKEPPSTGIWLRELRRMAHLSGLAAQMHGLTRWLSNVS